jgi:hypothetical protein
MKEIFIIKNHYKNDSQQDEKEVDIKKQKYHIKKPIKQKHSLAGNSYNKICSRSCYLINKLKQWTYCECIEKNKSKKIEI